MVIKWGHYYWFCNCVTFVTSNFETSSNISSLVESFFDWNSYRVGYNSLQIEFLRFCQFFRWVDLFRFVAKLKNHFWYLIFDIISALIDNLSNLIIGFELELNPSSRIFIRSLPYITISISQNSRNSIFTSSVIRPLRTLFTRFEISVFES